LYGLTLWRSVSMSAGKAMLAMSVPPTTERYFERSEVLR
jgi:hypothetical protein